MSRKQKVILREEMKRVLAHLDERWIKVASKEVCANLSSLLDDVIGDHVKHVLAWTAFFPGEVDLSSFISRQLEKREVYLPRLGLDRRMSFISIGHDWVSTFGSGAIGLPQVETTTGNIFNPALAAETAIIVPALAFDQLGNRLGRGGMHYERFFRKPEILEAVTIGVLWSLQMVGEVPIESHDLVVDWVCNEREFIKTGTRTDGEFNE